MGEDVFALCGRTIDEKVRVDEVVGEGGFAVVYRGFHLAFEQPVAIKCLKIPAHFDDRARTVFLAKFQEEGKMLFRLSQHASIVRVFDLGEVDSERGDRVPYLVLEWLDGEDLEAMLQRRAAAGQRPFSETEVLSLLRPVVDAIALAHRLGIAHRDLKPANLVLASTVQGELLKVLDFGIAKAMQEGETTAEKATRTSSGLHAFSPQYGAPEQFRSKRYGATGPWTDVHALGLMMTELVAGRPAMLGEEQADFYEQAMAETRPTPLACGTQVSDAFEALCRRCLAREPAERFQDAEGLLAAMDAVQMGVRDMMARGPLPTTAVDALRPRGVASGATPTEVAETKVAQIEAGNGEVRNGEAGNGAVRNGEAGNGAVGEREGAKPVAPEVPSLLPPAQVPPSPPFDPLDEHVPISSSDPAPTSEKPSPAVEEGGRTREKRAPSYAPLFVGGALALAAVLVGVALLSWWLPAQEQAKKQAKKQEKIGATAAVVGGTFRMGSEQGAPNQRPEHVVSVGDFELDVTEVTVEAFALCVQAGSCKPTETVYLTGVTESQAEKWSTFCNWGKAGRERHPMNCVDWNQAQAFCAWAGKRLPTEEQWEYAARAGAEQRAYVWGDAKPSKERLNACSLECVSMALKQGWKWSPLFDVDDGWASTAPVGSFPLGVGRWGQQDLAGNVWEWTASPFCTYGDNSPGACSKIHRVARGGGWASRYAGIFRTTFRAKFPKGYRSQDVGFRCAR